MPFDGSGNFTRSYNFVDDKNNGIKIVANRVDGEFDNYATAMNQVIMRSGITPLSGDLRMGSNTILGLGNGVVGTPALRFTSDTSTGVYAPAAGQIALSAGGVQRVNAHGTGVAVTGDLGVSGGGIFGSHVLSSGIVRAGSNMEVQDGGSFHTPYNGAVNTGGIRAGILCDGAGQTLLFYTANTYRGQFSAAGVFSTVGAASIGSTMDVLGTSVVINSKLLLQHDGTNAFIRPTNAASSLYLGANNTNIVQVASTGATVTGNLAASGALNVTGIATFASHVLSGGIVRAGSSMQVQDGGYFYTPYNGVTDTGTIRAGVQMDGASQTVNFVTANTYRGQFTAAGALSLVGAASIGGTLGVTGAVTLSSTLAVSGNTTIGGTLTVGGNTVWNAGNDGAGSGLDADLLDGQDSAYYTAIATRLGYTPANKAGDAFTGAISAVSPNSGSSGGLVLRDTAGNPNANYLQFTNNAASAQYGFVRGLSGGGLTFGGSGENARITDSEFLVGATVNTGIADGASANPGVQLLKDGGISSQRSGASNLALSKAAGFTDGNLQVFNVAGSGVGSISTNGATTAFNTTSDFRLKSNIEPAGDPGAIIDALQIVSHDWQSGYGSHVPYGIIAQDANSVYSPMVTPGDNNLTQVSRPWGVDPSKAVFLLWRELQLLRQRVAALEGL